MEHTTPEELAAERQEKKFKKQQNYLRERDVAEGGKHVP
jgi:hypothetical protein